MQKITLLGNLGKDPEERTTQNGVKLLSISLAVNYKKDTTVWYDLVIWENKLPLFAKMIPFLQKGSRILVMGNLNPPQIYQGKDGKSKIRMQCEPDFIQFVGSPAKAEEQQSLFNAPPLPRDDEELPF